SLTADSFSGDTDEPDSAHVVALQNGDAWGVQLVAFSYSGIGPKGGPAYPVQVGPGSPARYLVDQNQKPFLIQGDSPQSLFVNLTEKEAASFFANRAKAGFNVLWINLLCGTYTGGRADGSTSDGILPFANGEFFGVPNEDYFARVDRMIRMAASRGITILLDPAETGFFLITTSLLLDLGPGNAHDWGTYVGQRYRGFDNIIWMSGNDFQDYGDSNQDAVVQAVAQGIREQDPGHLQTVELNFNTSGSLDDPTWAPLIDLNASYTYFPTYAQVLTDYNRGNAIPTFLVESNYDFEFEAGTTNPPVSAPRILRRQAYWALTSGATGQMYGNGFIWPFLAGWPKHLNTPGSQQMGFVSRLFAPRRWFDLVPDQGHALVTSGFGTFESTCADVHSDCVGGNDYVTAARTPDGALAIAYLPALNAITVDLTQMSGPVNASWYDPSRGSLAKIKGSPFANTNDAQPFQPPGNNKGGDTDWVLLLEVAP
ncbi:MAG TPA: DUF4038 domain-containing protein, partial [Myxococcota bacterium]|nr:DUF4038 domain-containing protein [Myxococcota bacterium]